MKTPINFGDGIIVADLVKILPKNTIIVHEDWYNEKTGRSGVLVSTVMKNEGFMEAEIAQIRPIQYTKNKLAIQLILK